MGTSVHGHPRFSAARRPGALACLLLVAAIALVRGGLPPAPSWLGPAEVVARGVELFHLSDPRLLSPPGPVAAQLLRIDTTQADLRLVLAQDTVLETETVPSMARRVSALAAVNGGFFLPTGEPAGLFKIAGELVSDAPLQRGAVGFLRGPRGATRLLFDQVSARVELDVARRGGRSRMVPVAAVDSSRPPTGLVLFTPRFAIDTRTPCDGGTEWILEGHPWRIAEQRDAQCTALIPRRGAVLSAGPRASPEARGFRQGDEVRARAVYRPANGTDPADWERAADVVGGVGLLVRAGRAVGDWSPEKARDGFSTERHPRTMIGLARDGTVWLVTVDGRNPLLSLGMNFVELQGLADRLDLTDALNLDGGGSTTMVVGKAVVNHPSDPTGPRSVSDAIVVLPRGAGGGR